MNWRAVFFDTDMNLIPMCSDIDVILAMVERKNV